MLLQFMLGDGYLLLIVNNVLDLLLPDRNENIDSRPTDLTFAN